jgi:putative molybdopterin biosynthesis protein
MTTVGSTAGMTALRNGVADFATAHLLEPARSAAGDLATRELVPERIVIVELFYRELGLLVPHGNPKSVKCLRDLTRPNIRMMNRQPGSGTRLYLDQELSRGRLSPKKIRGYDTAVPTHLGVGLAVLRGAADVGLATRTTAHLLGLDFLPLTRERFDLLIHKERFFSPGVQVLLGIVASREFRERVGGLGGYDVNESGRIISSR